MKIAALIVAAGRGSRAASPGDRPKQYATLAGTSVLRRSVEPFLSHPSISRVTVVIHADDHQLYGAAIGDEASKLSAPVEGGATRQESVLRGLTNLAGEGFSHVLIHDAARPFVTIEIINALVDKLASAPAAIAAVPVTDTLKSESAAQYVRETVPRDGLWQAQTPQGFLFDAILFAHQRAATEHAAKFTDDAAIAEWTGIPVALALGSARNIKLTTREDLEMAEQRLQSEVLLEPRIGSGFDIHRFTDGDHVWLGGVKIPHTHKLDGHSDADVALHALTDALLGCISDGDIGQHFPPSDPQWKDAPSILFLKDAARRVADRGGRIVNVDVTILAEQPKVGPHRAAIQTIIGDCLGLSADRIGIKATTMEGLGAIGRQEGIAAMASASVLMPNSDADLTRRSR